MLITNHCIDYDTSLVKQDAAWKAAKAFGILALIIGGLYLIYFHWQVYRHDPNDSLGNTQKRISGAVFIVACFYQGFTLFFLRSSICGSTDDYELQGQLGVPLRPTIEVVFGDSCKLSEGAWMCIAATSCWFAASVFLYIPFPRKKTERSETPLEETNDASQNEQANNVRNQGRDTDRQKPQDDSFETAIISEDDNDEHDGGVDEEKQTVSHVRKVDAENQTQQPNSNANNPAKSNKQSAAIATEKRRSTKKTAQTKRRNYRS